MLCAMHGLRCQSKAVFTRDGSHKVMAVGFIAAPVHNMHGMLPSMDCFMLSCQAQIYSSHAEPRSLMRLDSACLSANASSCHVPSDLVCIVVQSGAAAVSHRIVYIGYALVGVKALVLGFIGRSDGRQVWNENSMGLHDCQPCMRRRSVCTGPT